MTDTITFTDFTAAHLPAAAVLSQAEGWPHRVEDWGLGLSLGRGVAAMAGDRLVGTALVTPFGDVATVNMIIVASDQRGKGLGRAVMSRAMALAAPRAWRLVATEDGLPLYRKLGFVETGTILQHQAPLPEEPVGVDADRAVAADAPEIARLDRVATGMARDALVAALLGAGEVAVLRDGARITAYAATRPFGRGAVVGPVVAADADAARRLISALLIGRRGSFTRIDTPADSGLAPWIAGLGLPEVGSGIAMRLGPPASPAAGGPRSFALASQALG
ncbi:MAG: GNAT family N-acetyltransferase [Amaricoccus sp.]